MEMKTGFLEVAQEAVKTLRALNDATATAFLANAMEQVAAAAYMGGQRDLGRAIAEAADRYGFREAAKKLHAWIENRERQQ